MGAPSLPCFRLEQTFFGFKPEDRVTLHSTLFNLIWVGEGRWDWNTIYNMPVFLRKYWIKRLNQINEEAKNQQEQPKKKNKYSKDKIAKPPM